MKHISCVVMSLILLAGCSREPERSTSISIKEDQSTDANPPQNEFGFREELQRPAIVEAIFGKTGGNDTVARVKNPNGTASGSTGANTPEIPFSVPKIAYSYTYGFRVSGKEIPALQRLHADHCEKLGPKQCRVISLSQDGSEGDYAHGSLNLEVAAPRARAFGTELAGIADKSGAEAVSSSIAGEDLSKQIVDTEARLRARIVLRDRLMEVLTSRKGSVAELVEAERGVAQVNEEIDQARSWLAEMNGRVDFSKVEVSYNAQNPSGGGFLSPIRAVLGNLGVILGSVIAAIIALGAVAVPLGLVFWGLRRLWRRVRPEAANAE